MLRGIQHIGIAASANGAVNYLLDLYPGAARAWADIRLRAAYNGYVIEVRRSSDGAHKDIGFINDVLDIATLLAFTGSGDSFISSLYDQSLNGKNLSIVNAIQQPKIVSNGAIVAGGIDFNGSTYLSNASSITYSGGVSFFSVQTLVNLSGRIWGDDITGIQGNTTMYSDGNMSLNDNGNGYKDIALPSFTTNVEQLVSFTFDDSNGDYSHSINGSIGTGNLGSWTGPIAPSGASNFGLMSAGNGSQFGNGKLKALIIYPDSQSSNEVGIINNLNNSYETY
jgi:hypothetical protein